MTKYYKKFEERWEELRKEHKESIEERQRIHEADLLMDALRLPPIEFIEGKEVSIIVWTKKEAKKIEETINQIKKKLGKYEKRFVFKITVDENLGINSRFEILDIRED